jgi:hypothetical protein
MQFFRQTYTHKNMQEVLQRMSLDGGDSIRILNLGLGGELEHDAENRLNHHEDEQDETSALRHEISVCALVHRSERLTR